MSCARARTISLEGATGHLVDVEVDVGHGLVATNLVGRPDASVQEARDRCRTAVTNSGFDWPTARRVTVLLSPAELPKRGSHFDLAIAAAVLVATGKVPQKGLADAVLIGELTLSGGLRAANGVLPMTMAAREHGIATVVVPEPQAAEATLVPGMTVIGVRSLGQLAAVLSGLPLPAAPEVPRPSAGSLLRWRGDDRLADADLADLIGMADPRYAVEVAAAGGHHVMLSGPKGAGKTTLAERIPGLLPDLAVEEALELTAVHSLAGTLVAGEGLLTRPPFFAPHHSATRVSLLGGGTGRVRPGELSRAHCGVLLLDEFPLFSSDILEALRQPLESGEVTIARGEETATYPARPLFVLACNPCPCGDYTARPADDRCSCSEVARREYRRKLSGPILDRVDITRHVEPVREHEARDPLARVESSALVRERVTRARTRQAERYAGLPWRLNAHVPGAALRDRWPLTGPATATLERATFAGRLTRRGAVRVHRLAWTIADLREEARPGTAELDVALRLRSGEPLTLDVLDGRRAG